MGKGFKLPGITPLKQTDSTDSGFFQPLNPRNYGASLTSPYANPQSYEAYFPSSTLGGSQTITDLGDTFSDIVTTVSGKGTDTDTSSDISGSDITINATGQLPKQITTDPGLERGSNPKLEARIIKAKNEGNLKKAARLQGKQDRKKVRQTEGEKRIQRRQKEKLDRVTKRQKDLTNAPLLMKTESPNKFVGANFLNSALGRNVTQVAGPSQAQQAAAASAAAGGTMGTESQNPMTGGLAAAGQAMGGASGGQTLNCTPVAMSYDPPLQANEKGGKKSVFNMNTKGMAETAFGTPAMRQASVGAPFQANAFYAALNDAKEKGAKTFEVGGKTFNVQNK